MNINFSRRNGLIPAIIQDVRSEKVLMLGYMNEEALKKTIDEQKVTFFSRTRRKLWTKGETSGNYLLVKEILSDCDKDTLLIKAHPTGPVCHTGQDTCFNEENRSNSKFLFELESIINDRKVRPKHKSYTSHLFKEGVKKVSQKIGEEAAEVIVEAVDDQVARLREESADLIYHLLVLLSLKEIKLNEVLDILEIRHNK
jgi:phosphoribosyl-ATP pyrophosphohydrolase/phosphoribosyl-AMP cyclohydrolase